MKIALVGERHGKYEASRGMAFVGESGNLLRRFLREVGLTGTLFTNVVNAYGDIPWATKGSGTPVSSGKYLPDHLQPEVERLYLELFDHQPDLIVALGGLATWAFLGGPVSIRQLGGTIHKWNDIPVLVTYNPAAVIYRQDNLKPFLLEHLRMGARYLDGSLPAEEYQVEVGFPSGKPRMESELAVDIETCRGLVDMVGVGTAEKVTVCTFANWPDGSPKHSAEEFVELYRLLGLSLGARVYEPGWDRFCDALGYRPLSPPEFPHLQKSLCFHNGGGFDMQYMLEMTGLDIWENFWNDTRVLGRCVDPEGIQGLKDLAPRYLGWQRWGWDHREMGEDK